MILAPAKIEPAPLFSRGAVLQRARPINVFGTGTPGAAVRVAFAGKSGAAEVGRDGTWNVRLSSLPAGGPFQMVVTGPGVRREIDDVMVGEVWLASGQSNMEWPVAETDEADEMRRGANSRVRIFRVRHNSVETPATRANGGWVRASESEALLTSGIGFGFAHKLRSRLDVPVGIVQATWGGSRIESWISRRMLAGDPATRAIADDYAASLADFDLRNERYREDLADWIGRSRRDDPGNLGYALGWARGDLDDAGWREATLPATTEALAGEQFEGALWIRKRFQVPAAWVGKTLRLELGSTLGSDTVYFNDVRIGGKNGRGDRTYPVAAKLVKGGDATLAVRLFDGSGGGGLMGPTIRLVCLATQEYVDLNGTWLAQIETELPPVNGGGMRPVSPLGPGHYNAVSGPFNGMIAPVLPFAMRGAIFYQGEANVQDPKLYGILLRELVRDWRLRADDQRWPFLYVQLPGIHEPPKLPTSSLWAELREEQQKALDLPATGMAVSIDLGDPNSIHPRKKLPIAHRLADIAFAQVYRLQGTSISPVMESWRADGNGIRITLSGVQYLKVPEDGEVKGLQIAGKDRRWTWARGKVFRNTLFVSADEIEHPEAVRYAWADGPEANLRTEYGLPVAPFRTDDWPE